MSDYRKRLHDNSRYYPKFSQKSTPQKTEPQDRSLPTKYSELLTSTFSKVFGNVDVHPDSNINKADFTTELQKSGIYSTTSYDIITMFKDEKFNTQQPSPDDHDNDHDDYSDDEDENKNPKIIDVHKIASAISVSDPTIISDLIVENQDFFLRHIGPNHRATLEEFNNNYRELKELKNQNPDDFDTQIDFSSLEPQQINNSWKIVYNEVMKQGIPACVHPYFEGIILYMDKLKEVYEDIKNLNHGLNFFEFVEFILLHELFHILVTRRAHENDLLNEFDDYMENGRADYGDTNTSSETFRINRLKSPVRIDCLRPPMNIVTLTQECSCHHIHLKEGYYFPLEEALANLFAYKHHPKEDKTIQGFRSITDNQSVGYCDWHKFFSKPIYHAAHVELGWMLKGKPFRDGVNVIHDLIIQNNPDRVDISEINTKLHQQQTHIFNNPRRTLETIQKETPVHIIVDSGTIINTTAEINKIITFIKSK